MLVIVLIKTIHVYRYISEADTRGAMGAVAPPRSTKKVSNLTFVINISFLEFGSSKYVHLSF
jgi:hypothetical protein